jgi:hypothetical protein
MGGLVGGGRILAPFQEPAQVEPEGLCGIRAGENFCHLGLELRRGPDD